MIIKMVEFCLKKFMFKLSNLNHVQKVQLCSIAPNCFKSYTNSWSPDFFKKKKVSSDVWSEIHLVQHNIASTGQAVRALKKSQLTAN